MIGNHKNSSKTNLFSFMYTEKKTTKYDFWTDFCQVDFVAFRFDFRLNTGDSLS